MQINYHLCSGPDPCQRIRTERAHYDGLDYDVHLHQCCSSPNIFGEYGNTWSHVAYALEQHLGIRLITRRKLDDWVRAYLTQNMHKLAELATAVCENGCRSGANDLIDRKSVSGLLGHIKRCKFCGRAGRTHEECEKKDHADWMQRWQDLRDQQDQVCRLRLYGKVAKIIERLSGMLEHEFTLKEARKILPYKTNSNSWFRLCLTGKIESRKIGRTWMVTGRGILALIKKWIDSGRAPCRTRHSTRMMQQYEEFHP